MAASRTHPRVPFLRSCGARIGYPCLADFLFEGSKFCSEGALDGNVYVISRKHSSRQRLFGPESLHIFKSPLSGVAKCLCAHHSLDKLLFKPLLNNIFDHVARTWNVLVR